MKDQLEHEQKKYEQLWKLDRYRLGSPGLDRCRRAIEIMEIQSGSSLIDIGCGAGKASAVFMSKGIDVAGIDIAYNCLDHDVIMPLKVGCLWSSSFMSSIDLYEYGFCCDVMEHIPTNRVDKVFELISLIVDKSIFFNISLTPDSCGKLIGELLHLTVKPKEWWRNMLEKRFDVKELEMINKNTIEFICMPNKINKKLNSYNS